MAAEKFHWFYAEWCEKYGVGAGTFGKSWLPWDSDFVARSVEEVMENFYTDDDAHPVIFESWTVGDTVYRYENHISQNSEVIWVLRKEEHLNPDEVVSYEEVRRIREENNLT